MSKVKYCKGTKIICPKCNNLCGVANADIYPMGVAKSSEWDGIESGSTPNCCKCGTMYTDNFVHLHTQFGWRRETTREEISKESEINV